MSNLTTRKIVLGMLMVLVLAFSVQGIADALSFRESRTGDLQTIVTTNEFTVSLTVVPGSNTTRITNNDGDLVSDNDTRINSSGYPIVEIAGRVYRTSSAANSVNGFRRPISGETDDQSAIGAHVVDGSSDSAASVVDSEGRAIYTTDGGGTRATAAPDAKLSGANRYHFNQESISISVPTGTTLTKVGNFRVNVAGGSSHPMNELASSTNENKLTSSLRLTFRAGSVGEKIITISDETPEDDRPGNASQPLSFTIFVVPALDSTTDLSLAGANGYTIGNDNADQQVNTLFTSGNDVPLVYRVEGSGRLYVERVYDTDDADADGSPMSRSSATQTLSTSSRANVYLDMNGGSNKVTAYVRDRNSAETGRTVAFIFNYAAIEIISGNNQTGVPNARLSEPLGIRIKDSRGRAVLGLAVTFTPADGATLEPIIGTDVYLTTGNTWASAFSSNLKTFQATRTVPADIQEDAAALVPTDRSGEAQVYLKVGAAGTNKTVTVSAGGATKTFYATSSTSTDIPSLEIVSGDNQRSDSNGKVADPLVVRVLKNNNRPSPGEVVTFTTTRGYLTTEGDYQSDSIPQGGTTDGPLTRVTAVTDASGEAAVSYDLVNHTGAAEVTAEISGLVLRRVTFSINGSGARQPRQPDPPPAAGTDTITITLSETTGEPGDEIDVTISASPNTVVVIDSGDLDGDDFSREFGTTPFDTVISLPDEEDDYTFTAEATGYTSDSATVTVETGILGTISISQIGTPSNGAQSFSITVVDTDSARISGSLTVRVSGSGFTTRNVDTLNGVGNARLTLPTAASLYTLTASAEGYTSGTTQVRIAGTGQQEVDDEEEEEVEEEVTVAAEPDSVGIVGPSQRDGTANTVLDAALIVEVVDDDGDAVADARVIFRVRTGQGRLSERGNGRAVAVQTDSRGHARATYTPISASSTVEAEARGVTRRVTFTITASGGSAGPVSRDADGTPSGDISPVVHVGAAQRPPMLWVDGGAIYALVGASPERFAPSVDNALNLTVGGGKVYWTEKTGESGGTINSANVDGSGVTELASIFATPMGIAVDVTNSTLYWTNSAGRIQSANLDGSRITNVIPGGLDTPMDIALAGGNAYWTQGGNVRFVNLRGTKQIRNVSTGTDAAGSLVIGGGKVYWTEKTGESGGTVNSANLNGTGATPLASILAAPIGIALDGSRSKLYWTNARGRVQSANLDGSGIKNVVDGLGSPGELVLSNSIAAPAGAGSSAGSGKTASGSKYDVNGDGTVDIGDSDALTIALAANSTDPKYDVDGNGKVDIFDLIEVRAKYSPGAAGAPTLFGMKLSAVQIDHLQEQIDLLIATNDRSPAAMRTLVYLQQLLVTARPEKTQLLANYPNPFNPETWIPYELATDTDVRITIYNTQGVVIRSLQLGHQSAGYYVGRDRAAYWDGRNALGEQVASGLYFYQLETDEMSLMRKMVILK